MRVTIKINYRTMWGESVYVTGNASSIGDCVIEKSLKLNSVDGSNWEITFDAESIEELSYNYLIKTDYGIIRRKEWGKPHTINVSTNAFSTIVFDNWHDMPDNAVFFSTAFTEGIFNRNRDKSDQEAKPNDIVINVFAPMINAKQVLAITGNTPELGQWDVRKAKTLNCKNFPKWTAVINSSASSFEYKFVLLDANTHDLIEWESGDNRVFDIDRPNGAVVVVNDLYLTGVSHAWMGAGTAVPVFSLRSKQDFGVGDFYDLFKMIDWAEASNQRILQLLPINDTTMTKTWMDSYPYNANSTFALHPMYIRPDAIGELEDKDLAKKLRGKANELNALTSVDYEASTQLKETYTKALFAQMGESVAKQPSFRSFVKNNSAWLKPYAVYSVLRDEYKTPDFKKWGSYSVYNEASVDEFAQKHKSEIEYIYFIQYFLDKQLREVRNYAHKHNVVLKGDIPIGISAVSVDAWLYPELFHMDCQAGAPPDDFSVMGQNWGFPTYNWEVMARDGYRWWKNRFRKMAEYFDAYRIDHILGFFRIWQIPTESIHGLLGTFYPALPYSEDELRNNYGFWMNRDMYTKPYIHEWFIEDYFGEYTQEAKERFLIDNGDLTYSLQTFVSTQKNVVEYFSQFPEDDKNNKLRDELLKLIDDVLFIVDKDDDTKYHPRISAQHTHIYNALNDYEKNCFNRLYNDFYYHRHNDFWKTNALQKLPALTQSTDMLVCGEDLGMIPDCVSDVMNSQKYLSLEIPRMPKEVGVEFGNTYAYPYLSVCTTSTHDMSGIRAWWEEDKEATQRYFNQVLGKWGVAPEVASPEICQEMVNRCLCSPSILCILPLQDWMSMDGCIRRDNPKDEQINVPAVSRHYWRYRMHLTLEDLNANRDFTSLVKNCIEKAGR